jgi:hypothetical protein
MGIYGDLEKLNDRKYVEQPQPQEAPPIAPVVSAGKSERVEEVRPITMPPRHRDTTTPRNRATKPPRNRGGTVSRYHDSLIRAVRAAVKRFGKEAATHRFTLEEKKVIADIVYRYKQVGIRTSENEITRIGVNFILSDYEVNGERSILNRVLKALNS